MKIFGATTLLPHVWRFAIIMFAAGMTLPSLLPSQKAKELIRQAY